MLNHENLHVCFPVIPKSIDKNLQSYYSNNTNVFSFIITLLRRITYIGKKSGLNGFIREGC